MTPTVAAFLAGMLAGGLVVFVAGAWWLVHGWSGDS